MTGSGAIGDPYIGEIRLGKSIDYSSNHEWIWIACIDCGKERWVKLTNSKPDSPRCNSCATKRHGMTFVHWVITLTRKTNVSCNGW